MEKTKDLQGSPLDQHVLDLLGNPPLEQVATAMDDYNRDHAGGSILIEWEPRWVFRVPYMDVIDSMGDFARMSRPERRAIIGSINRSIATLFPLVKARTASQREFMDCTQDVALWFAHEVHTGRAKLSQHYVRHQQQKTTDE
jgi:hypothetical protein